MNPDTFNPGRQILDDAGYAVFVHPQCYAHTGQIAGPADVRAAALMELLLDRTIDAVWLMGGGHRAAELLPLLDWDALKHIPSKPVLGFSDGSIIIYALQARLGWTTYFAPTVQSLGRMPDLWPLAEKALNGQPEPIVCDYTGPGVTGRVIASTLSLLPLLLETEDVPELQGAILCIEDTNEELTTIDRHMLFLKRRGVFDKVAALVCGSFTHMGDSGRPFEFTLSEVMQHHAGAVPVAMNGQFGHGEIFYPLPVGGTGRLENNVLSFM